jgi:hypothetical protein
MSSELLRRVGKVRSDISEESTDSTFGVTELIPDVCLSDWEKKISRLHREV